MKELENLLTSLIERGWKPAGFPGKSEIKISEDWDVVLYMDTDDATVVVKVKLRNLVSLESGLWQFVCENELYKEDDCWEWRFTFDGVHFFYYKSLPKFRLLESSLIPEEELAKFLVENIKI